MQGFDLKTLEAKRLADQDRLDAKRDAVERNKEGQFATPSSLAHSIAKFVLPLVTIDKPLLLEPSSGSGAFISAALSEAKKLGMTFERIIGVEKDKEFADLAAELWGPFGAEIVNQDFLEFASSATPTANLLMANPPYVRHHHMSREAKARYSEISSRVSGQSPSGLSGLYVYFILSAHLCLAPGAVSAWLVPSEFLDTNYGKFVRKYLAETVSVERIHRFNPDGLVFDDALVTSLILVFKNQKPDESHLVTFSEGDDINDPEIQKVTFPQSALRGENRWSGYFLHEPATNHHNVELTLSDFFTIRRGIATGNNSYFIRPRPEVLAEGIDDSDLIPVLPPPRRLNLLAVPADEDGWPLAAEQLVLMSSSESESTLATKNPNLARYFKAADEKTRNSYLVRNRSPWYKVESREPAPFLLTYMGRANGKGAPFRFILNRSKAIATNGYLMLYPCGELKKAIRDGLLTLDDVHATLNQFSQDSLIAGGRVYGGGLRKIEPKELSNIPAAHLGRQLGLQGCTRQDVLF